MGGGVDGGRHADDYQRKRSELARTRARSSPPATAPLARARPPPHSALKDPPPWRRPSLGAFVHPAAAPARGGAFYGGTAACTAAGWEQWGGGGGKGGWAVLGLGGRGARRRGGGLRRRWRVPAAQTMRAGALSRRWPPPPFSPFPHFPPPPPPNTPLPHASQPHARPHCYCAGAKGCGLQQSAAAWVLAWGGGLGACCAVAARTSGRRERARQRRG